MLLQWVPSGCPLLRLDGFSKVANHAEQNDANLILIDADRFVDLFLDNYENLSADMRHRFPLQPVYGVAGGDSGGTSGGGGGA